MPDVVHPRDGPVWIKGITIVDGDRRMDGFLEGQNMNKIKVFAVLPQRQKGNVISEGMLRVKPGWDQGNVASYLVYIPNKRKYPNQEMKILQRVV